MRPFHILVALAVLSACGDRSAPPVQTSAGSAAPALLPPVSAPVNAAGLPSPLVPPIPAYSTGKRAEPLAHAPLPLERAAADLPRGPFLLIRSEDDLAKLWTRARGMGPPPAVDFSRSAVLALRLPAGAARDEFAPTTHPVAGQTQVLLRPGTPNAVGIRPADRLELYEISTAGGPVSRVRFDRG